MVCSASGSPRLSAANKEELFEIISILFLLLSITHFSLNVPVFAIFTLVYPLTHLFFNINCHLTPSLKSMLPLICPSSPSPCPVPWFGKICSPGRFVLQWKMFNAINRFLKKGPWKNGKFANRRPTPSPLLSVSFLCFLHSCIVSEPSPSCSWYCETSVNPFPMYQVLLLCLNLSPSCSSEC